MKKSILVSIVTATMISGTVHNLSAQSPGDIVGTTEYIYQSDPASGDRMVVDSQSGVHFAWTNGTGWSGQRSVFYNYVDSDGNWLIPGQGESIGENGTGYCQIALTAADCAGIAYQTPFDNYVVYAVDNFSGFGVFSYYDPPDMLRYRCFWPYLAIDISDAIHIVMMENTSNPGDPAEIGYTSSAGGDSDWSELVVVDTSTAFSTIVSASPVSGKVAIVYSHPTDLNSQVKNDIYYVESSDGINWDWEDGKTNITEYGQNGDSLFAYANIDAIYDYNDNLHIIWDAFWVTDDGIRNENFLYHYDIQSGAISFVESINIDLGACQFYPWNRPINKMTLGVQEETGALYTVYTRFDPDDCSSSGYANGDLFTQYSIDGGLSWSLPVNITDSQSPDCIPGECYSDLWPSLADKVTDYLHVFYVVDRAGGGSWGGENPMLYYKYPVNILSAGHNSGIPRNIELRQNYPNPFNAATTIEFELFEDSDVNLAVYDITGALVEVLHDGYLNAGKKAIAWNAEDIASGAYFYKLSTDDGSKIRKMVLLK